MPKTPKHGFPLKDCPFCGHPLTRVPDLEKTKECKYCEENNGIRFHISKTKSVKMGAL
jgi:hypothetical protein